MWPALGLLSSVQLWGDQTSLRQKANHRLARLIKNWVSGLVILRTFESKRQTPIPNIILSTEMTNAVLPQPHN